MSEETLNCGLVMPISTIDGCPAEHWSEVNNIITDAVESIEKYKFHVSLVSEADNIGVIQRRIVQNLYNADLVICDVSCKNPNVMFELGMRLAFDKPAIIIKDDKTDYSFDTGIIEHIPYPRDLRFNRILEFKEKLIKKVIATYEDYSSNPDHSTFLKNFGQFKVAALDETTVTPDHMILQSLTDIQNEIVLLKRQNRKREHLDPKTLGDVVNILNAYKENNNIDDVQQLMDSRELYEIVESKINARKYFLTRQDFNNYIKDLLLSLYV